MVLCPQVKIGAATLRTHLSSFQVCETQIFNNMYAMKKHRKSGTMVPIPETGLWDYGIKPTSSQKYHFRAFSLLYFYHNGGSHLPVLTYKLKADYNACRDITGRTRSDLRERFESAH
jgi:hypothetical protein